MKVSTAIPLIVISFLVGALASAQSQNQLGFVPVGSFAKGQCLQVGDPVGSNAMTLVAVPCQQSPPLSIGTKINGTATNSCLSADANGNLANASCLLAN